MIALRVVAVVMVAVVMVAVMIIVVMIALRVVAVVMVAVGTNRVLRVRLQQRLKRLLNALETLYQRDDKFRQNRRLMRNFLKSPVEFFHHV